MSDDKPHSLTFTAAELHNPQALAASRNRGGQRKAEVQMRPKPVWWEMDGPEFEKWLEAGGVAPEPEPESPLQAALRAAGLTNVAACRAIGFANQWTFNAYMRGERTMPPEVERALWALVRA